MYRSANNFTGLEMNSIVNVMHVENDKEMQSQYILKWAKLYEINYITSLDRLQVKF